MPVVGKYQNRIQTNYFAASSKHKEKDDNRRDALTIKKSRKKADRSDDESNANSSSSSIVVGDRKRSSKRHSRKRHRRTKKRRRRHSETREHTSSQEHKISRAKTSSLEELRRRHNERSEQEALREKGIKDRATFSENFNLTRGTYINRKIRLNSNLVANFPNHWQIITIGVPLRAIAPDLSCRSGIILWCYRTGKSGLSVKRIVSISVSRQAKLRGDLDSTCFSDGNGEWIHLFKPVHYLFLDLCVQMCVVVLLYPTY